MHFNDMTIDVEYELLNQIIDIEKYVTTPYKHKDRGSYHHKNKSGNLAINSLAEKLLKIEQFPVQLCLVQTGEKYVKGKEAAFGYKCANTFCGEVNEDLANHH